MLVVKSEKQTYADEDARRVAEGDSEKLGMQDALTAIKGGADAEHIWLNDNSYSDAAREFARCWFEYGELSDDDLNDLGFVA